MNKDHIHEFWESQGVKHDDSHWASWGDNWAIELEIETVARHLNDGDRVLDVGCANGFSSLRQLEKHALASVTGVDFAASMIAAANRAKAKRGLGDNVSFAEGDVRSLAFADESFDAVYTTRVLINLATWEEQKQGIRECLRVTRPGGTVILCEGFWEPLMLLNALRALTGLPPLVEHDFNRYLKRSSLEAFLGGLGLEWKVEDFSSLYYLGSRLVRELVTDASAYPGYSNPINKIFYELEKQFSGGGMGIQQAFVIRRR
jgi:ubiquinone/menaquinone biosynthesis C-methylase UbiE